MQLLGASTGGRARGASHWQTLLNKLLLACSAEPGSAACSKGRAVQHSMHPSLISGYPPDTTQHRMHIQSHRHMQTRLPSWRTRLLSIVRLRLLCHPKSNPRPLVRNTKCILQRSKHPLAHADMLDSQYLAGRQAAQYCQFMQADSCATGCTHNLDLMQHSKQMPGTPTAGCEATKPAARQLAAGLVCCQFMQADSFATRCTLSHEKKIQHSRQTL